MTDNPWGLVDPDKQKQVRSICRLSHWWPVAESLLEPTLLPATTLVDISDTYPGRMYAEFLCEPEYEHVLQAAANKIEAAGAYPFFLRSDIVSGKHCHPKSRGPVHDRNELLETIVNIAEFASNALWFQDNGMDVWARREILQPPDFTKGLTVLRGLPLVPEWRLIYRNNVYSSESGFYWPSEVYDSIKCDGVALPHDEVETVIQNLMTHPPLNWMDIESTRVIKALGGDWSIDWMLTDRGFVMIDMALANESWIPNPVNPPPPAPEIDYKSLLEFPDE